MKKLYQIGEVSKITGVSIKTIRGYINTNISKRGGNKEVVSLLPISGISDSGNFLFDAEAIKRIYLILFFQEAGYERKKIKEILESPNLSEEIEKTIHDIEEKQKRLNGLLFMAKRFLSDSKLTRNTYVALSKISFNKINNLNWKKDLTTITESISNLSEDEKSLAEKISSLSTCLFAIAGLMETYKPESKLVQNCVYDLFYSIVQKFSEDDEELTEEDLTDEELFSSESMDSFIEFINLVFLSEPEIVENYTKLFGPNYVTYINDALIKFKELALKGYWNKSVNN